MRKLFAAAAMVLAVGIGQAQAEPITGGINFGLDASPNTGDWSTATAVDFGVAPNGSVLSRTGSYAAVPKFTTATFTDFQFDPFVGTVSPLWTLVYNSRTYSFDLASIDADSYDSATKTRSLSGTGYLNISGTGPSYDSTLSTFFFSGQGTGINFSASATNVAVPDGGATLMLLGGALATLGVLRRRFNA